MKEKKYIKLFPCGAHSRIKSGVFFLMIIFPVLVNAVSFDRIGVGPRPLAMSGAFTAAADDISSIYYNAAGLASMKRNVWSMAYDNLYGLGLFNYFFLGYAQPRTGPGTLGLSWTFLNLGENISLKNYNENTFMLSYGLPLAGRVKAGFSGKLYVADYNKSLGTGITADIGLIYDIGSGLSAGVSWRDLTSPAIFWDTKWTDQIISGLDAGLAWRGGERILVSVDGHDLLTDDRCLACGAEVRFFNGVLMVRSGFSISRIFSFSVGMGVYVLDCEFDYGLRKHEDLGWDNSFSASIRI
jgi:hypothetical protein